MRRSSLIAAACVLVGLWTGVASADVAPFARYDGELHRGTYDWATGRMTPIEQTTRGGEDPMWAAEYDPIGATYYWVTSYTYSNGGVIAPGFVFAMDWGDLENAGDPARRVGSFDIGYNTDMTYDPSGETGLNLLLGFYKNYDGITAVQDFPGGYYEPEWLTGFQWVNLGGYPGGPSGGGHVAWFLPSGNLTSVLPNDPNGPFDWSFSLDGDDIDGDGNADFGYAFYFIDTLDASEAGWLIGRDVSNATGATNDFFDYELMQDPNMDPNDPNAYFFILSSWWWFGGEPFAQAFLRLWGVGDDFCPAECSTSLDDDCDVDFDDLNVLLSVYGGNPGHPADFLPPPGVDFDDLNLLLSQYGNNCDAP